MEQLEWLSESEFQILVDHLQEGIFVIEAEKFSYVNQRMADLCGYRVDEIIGRSFMDFIAEEDREMVLGRHRARLSGEKPPEHYDLHIITGQNEKICCSLNVGLSVNRSGRPIAVGSLRDVTERRAVQAELQAIFDYLPDVFYRTNMDGVVEKISPSCFEHLGYHPEEMLGTPLAGYYATPEERQKVVNAILDGGGKATQVEAALKRKDGKVIWVSTSASVRSSPEGRPLYIEGLARDISERKRMEEQLLTMSRIDILTGACNRSYFMERSEEVVRMIKRYQHSATIMMFDLDYFKSINDRYGHQAGDLVLQAFAQVCRKEIRESDIFGRMGGEEFALMLPETFIHEAEVLAERIRGATAALAITFEGQVVGISVSIGLAQVSDGERALESALRLADIAMYKAKENGRNQVVVSSK